MYYFVYYIDTIAFYWQEKQTSYNEWNKTIDNSRTKIVKYAVAKDQYEKKRCVITNTTIQRV